MLVLGVSGQRYDSLPSNWVIGGVRPPDPRGSRSDDLPVAGQVRDVVDRLARARREAEPEDDAAAPDRLHVVAVDAARVRVVVGQRAALIEHQILRVVGVAAVGREVVLVILVETLVVANQARVGVRGVNQPLLREALVDEQRERVVGPLGLGLRGQALEVAEQRLRGRRADSAPAPAPPAPRSWPRASVALSSSIWRCATSAVYWVIWFWYAVIASAGTLPGLASTKLKS